MSILHIYTPYGNHYKVNAKGQIYKDGLTPNDDWRMLGIGRVNSDRIEVRFTDLTPERLDDLTLKYKNGHPRYTVHDIDHGTHRSWGNTVVHGISSMWFEEA